MITLDNIINITSAFFALIGIIFIIIEIRNNNKISEADFIYRLRKDFYSDESKFIMFFIKEGKIKYKSEENYFSLDEKFVSELEDQYNSYRDFAKKFNYTIHIQDMDNYVLGYLNDIGEYRKKKIISLNYIVNSFNEPFKTLEENGEMNNYLEEFKKDYEFIEDIKNEVLKENI